MKKTSIYALASLCLLGGVLHACKPKKAGHIAVDDDAAKQVYVAPGHYDEYYDFVSGGFSGQVSVYGIPSGRLLKVIPVFSQNGQPGPISTQLYTKLRNIQYGIEPDTHNWITIID